MNPNAAKVEDAAAPGVQGWASTKTPCEEKLKGWVS